MYELLPLCLRRGRSSTVGELPQSGAGPRRPDIVRRVESRFPDGPAPWGLSQPTFERILTDGDGRYFLEGRDASGEPIRVQLVAAGLLPAD